MIGIHSIIDQINIVAVLVLLITGHMHHSIVLHVKGHKLKSVFLQNELSDQLLKSGKIHDNCRWRDPPRCSSC